MRAGKAEGGSEKCGVIFHGIEAGDAADDEGVIGQAPRMSLRATGGRIGPHRLRIDTIGNNRNAPRVHAARDRIGAHGVPIGDDQVRPPRQPDFQPVRQR